MVTKIIKHENYMSEDIGTEFPQVENQVLFFSQKSQY